MGVKGGGGRRAIIVSGRKHACLIIIFQYLFYQYRIIIKKLAYPMSFAATYPIPKTLMQASAFWRDHGPFFDPDDSFGS